MAVVLDTLILGAGWTSTFLIPLLSERSLAYMATTRDGRANTVQFTFDPDSDEAQPFKALPSARFILITFPIVVTGASARLVRLYIETHPEISTCSFIQLGSTGIWDASHLAHIPMALASR